MKAIARGRQWADDLFTEDSDRKPDPADLIPEQTGPRVARLGDVWELGRHRVLCGSALKDSNYAALMKAEKAASVFTDPPYNVRIEGNVSGLGKNRHRDFAMASGEMSAAEFTLFLTKALVLAAGYSEPGSLAYVCIDWRHTGEMLAAGKTAYSELKNICAWIKDKPGMGSFYRSQHELIFVFKNDPSHSGNGDPRSFDRAPFTVAERLRRTPHRIDSARKPRSPGRVRRSAVASRSEEVHLPYKPPSAGSSAP
jgi:hypothetical protein